MYGAFFRVRASAAMVSSRQHFAVFRPCVGLHRVTACLDCITEQGVWLVSEALLL